MSAVPIPARMAHLRRDRRGLPVPVVVEWEGDVPRFAVNDSAQTLRVVRDGRCGLCGQLLKGNTWFVAGPVAALTGHGVYLDPPMHKDCAVYALKVCPYLAAPRYASDGAAAIKAAERMGLAVQPLQPDAHLADRPEVFVLSKARSYTFDVTRRFGLKIEPRRPWLAVEFWRQGVRIDGEEARPYIVRRFAELADVIPEELA